MNHWVSIFDPMPVFISHVQKTDIDGYDLHEDAIIIRSDQWFFFIWGIFNVYHQPNNADKPCNQNLDFTRSCSQVFSGEDHRKFSNHNSKFVNMLATSSAKEEKAVLEVEFFNSALISRFSFTFIHIKINKLFLIIDSPDYKSRN